MASSFTHFTHTFPDRLVESSAPPFNQWKNQCRRAGIERRYVAETETIHELAIRALRKLFAQTCSQPACTAVVLATTRKDGDADFSIQATARSIAESFDIPIAEGINYACCGFSAAVGRALELRQEHEHVAVVCSEVASHGLNYDDPATAVLFGDGAGATSISSHGTFPIFSAWAQEFNDPYHAIDAVQGMFPDFNGNKLCRMVFRMSGMTTLDAAVQVLTDTTIPEIERHADKKIAIVPHQPSRPVLQEFERALAHKNMHPPIIADLKDTGNLVSASVPVALSRNIQSIAHGTMIICPTVGGGPNLEIGKMSKRIVTFMRR